MDHSRNQVNLAHSELTDRIVGVFFEVVVGIGGRGYGAPRGYALAVLLIGAGLVLLARRLLTARRP